MSIRLNTRFERRHFLKAAGGLAALTPFVPLLSAEAEAGGIPKRLVLMFHAHGVVLKDWLPQGGERDFTFKKGGTLEPLARHRDKLVVVDGLRMPGREDAGPPHGGPHTRNTSWLWSAAPLASEGSFKRDEVSFGWGTGTSIDQSVAEAIGAMTPYRSLELGVMLGNRLMPHNTMIYRAPGQPLAPQTNPQLIFDRLFADFVRDQDKVARVRRKRGSVLDLVRQEVGQMTPRVSSGDREKLEAHFEAIRTLERQMQREAELSCSPTMLGQSHNPQDTSAMPALTRQQIDLLVSAFACDLTRVGSIQFDDNENSGTRYSFLFEDDRAHHAISHDPSSSGKLTQIHRWHAEQLAYLMDRLEAIPEGEGTMLENTLIVWGTEIGVPWDHSTNRMPFVLAGGAGGALKMGRSLSYKEVPHQRLLVAIAQLMGLKTTSTYGPADPGRGPLQGLL